MALVETIGNLIEGVYNFITFIPQGIAYIVNTLAYMPAEITVFMTATMFTTIVLLILGRN